MSTGSGTLQSAETKLRGILSEQEEPTEAPNTVEEPAETVKAEAETLQSDTEPKSRRVKAKLADRDIEFDVLTEDVDLDLIPKGLMMEADYRRKTMELAEQRKAFEADQSKYNDKIKDLEDTLALDIEDLESAEMQELKEDGDPEYWRKYELAEKKSKRLLKYRQELAEKDKKRIDAEFQKLKDSTPDWLDDSVMKKDFDTVAETLRKSGIEDAEMMKYFSHKLFPLFKKAALYDQMSNMNLEDKRVKSAPKSTRPESKTALEDAATKQNKALDKLKQTGKLRDAQQALKQFL